MDRGITHRIANFPFIITERPDEYGRMIYQPIVQFKSTFSSRIGHLLWLREFKPDEYNRRMDAGG